MFFFLFDNNNNKNIYIYFLKYMYPSVNFQHLPCSRHVMACSSYNIIKVSQTCSGITGGLFLSMNSRSIPSTFFRRPLLLFTMGCPSITPFNRICSGSTEKTQRAHSASTHFAHDLQCGVLCVLRSKYGYMLPCG